MISRYTPQNTTYDPSLKYQEWSEFLKFITSLIQ